jgi:DNA invertase Pin-like site-specific DNA recombinase
MAEGKIFGYGSISDKSKNEAQQMKALLEYGINERDIYIDKMSGKDFKRENYTLLKERLLCKGDTLVVKELDMLGKNYDMIKVEWTFFIQSGINIVILDMPILNTKDKSNLEKRLISDIVLSLLSYFAEKEGFKNKIRQREGSISTLKACNEPDISPPTFYSQINRPHIKKPTYIDLKSKAHQELDRLANMIEKEG